MKTKLSLIVATVSFITGTLLSYGGNSAAWNYLTSDVTMAIAASLGLVVVAINDYMRKPRSITLPISRSPSVLRPAVPVANSKGYSIRRQRALIERAAA